MSIPQSFHETKEIRQSPVEIEPQVEISKQEEEMNQPQNIRSSKKSKSNNEYLHAGEDFYNTDGFEAGRYNLRRRGETKRYIEEDIDIEEEIQMKKYKKAFIASASKQALKQANLGFGMGGYGNPIMND